MKLRDIIDVAWGNVTIYENDWSAPLLTLYDVEDFGGNELSDVMHESYLDRKVLSIKAINDKQIGVMIEYNFSEDKEDENKDKQ